MAVPEHQHRLRRQIQRKGRDPRFPVGPQRPQPPDDHVDARASRLSLPRGHRQQPHRALQASRRRSEFRPIREAMGTARLIAAIREFANQILGRGEATITVPSFDGALKPNQKLEEALFFECAAPEDLATDGANLYLADGPRLLRLEHDAATEIRSLDQPISALTCMAGGALAVALG